MKVVEYLTEVRTICDEQRASGKSVGFVPTMGAFHEGHLSLIRAAGKENDFVVVSIFINPTQFGSAEDLDAYPRQRKDDIEKARDLGVDLVFVPANEEMYPGGYCTYVVSEKLGAQLCGASRPGHFRGVATVCTKLFNVVGPCSTYFGQKDAQQAIIVRQLIKDLNLPVSMRIMPIVREADGLAMSSRNEYLSESERQDALCLYKALQLAERLFNEGERQTEVIVREMQSRIESAGSARVDYIDVVDAHGLDPMSRIDRDALVALAVFIGDTRLIDNVVLKP